MSSARRPRTGLRRSAKCSEAVADREEDGGNRTKQRVCSTSRSSSYKKRKLSDMLGPPWTENDLKLFYQAYRKHGRDWKKVASIFQNRTAEMVEVLYSMNKAYLSLPQGAASAAGLIALMTDHYNILEENKSGEDDSSEDFPGSDPALLRNKYSSLTSGGVSRARALQVASGPSYYGGPSPSKKPRTAAASRPRFVGKRTPRVPMMHFVEKKNTAEVASNKKQEDLEQDFFGDCDEVQVALTLAAASQRAASPQISRTPASRTERLKHSPVQNGYVKKIEPGTESGGSGSRNTGSNMDDGGIEGSQDNKNVENGLLTKGSTSIAMNGTRVAGANGFATGEVRSRLRQKNPNSKTSKVQGIDNSRFDDSKEECSCTEEGTARRQESEKGDVFDKGVKGGMKLTQAQKKKRPPLQRPKRKSRQLFSGDDRSGLDALATLADLSLNGLLPSPRVDSEPAAKMGEDIEETAPSMVDASTREIEEFVKDTLEVHLELQSGDFKSDVTGRLKEMPAKVDTGSVVESDCQRATSIAEFKKRKRKAIVEEVGTCADSGFGDPEGKLEVPSSHGEDVKPRSKLKRSVHGQSLNKQACKQVKHSEACPSDQVHDIQEGAVGKSDLEQNPVASVAIIPVRQRSRRKVDSEKVVESLVSGASVDGEGIAGDPAYSFVEPSKRAIMHCPHSTAELGPSSIKARLMHCLSSSKFRRWCTYEWFYSAVDLPWFAQNEFVDYLNHAGLGHVPRLTRVEWGVIRSSLGKPRRLSKRFLQEERDKLDLYRESVRKHYQEVRTGYRDGLPTDLPKPLAVGQRVIAHHPKTKEIYDGSILTVDRSRCRVQFDRTELGVELVSDIDAMPVNSLENLSEILIRRSGLLVDGMDRSNEDLICDAKSRVASSAGIAARAALNERLERPGALSSFATPSRYSLNALCKQAQAADTVDSVIQAKAAANEAVAVAQQSMYNQPCTLAQVQAREADIRALADLTRALDKKEALLLELRNMNDDVDLNRKGGEAVRNSEPFQKQYATVLLQLKEVNKQVRIALTQLRQRNRYQENTAPPWQSTSVQQASSFPSSSTLDLSSSGSLDQRPPSGELSLNAIQYARLMVATAMKAMSSLKEGEDALSKIGGALKSLPKVDIAITMADEGGSQKVHVGLTTCQVSSSLSFGTETSVRIEDVATETKDEGSINEKETRLAELMASCVATLLMVQAFTEKQFPAAEVAIAIDSVLASLQPHSPQNLSIYKDIEHYAGLLKNQIVALLPTQLNASLLDCPPTSN